MLQIQQLSQELPICGNIPFFVNLCSSLWIVSLLLVFGFEMTHSQLFLFSFKNLKSCECFAGFNVNVWGQDFFSFVSLQKSCIWPQESPKGFNYTPCNVENIWTSWPWTTFSSRRKKLLGSTRLQSIPWLGGLYKIGLDHICAWESELLVIVVCSYRGAHTAACRNPHSTGSFSQEYVRNPKLPWLLKK